MDSHEIIAMDVLCLSLPLSIYRIHYVTLTIKLLCVLYIMAIGLLHNTLANGLEVINKWYVTKELN